MVNVISFCLYGNKATYILGMIENIKIAKNIYKNWDIYIYFNETVPENFIKEYLELGAKCIKCENLSKNKMNFEGMLWRYMPLDEKDVEFWISRDADSRLSQREFNLVDEWMKSNKTLHVIRDHRCHFNYIMGGMFGINNKLFRERYSGKIKTIRETIKDLYQYYKERPYNVDQIWLNDKFWNVLKDDSIAHISKEARRVYETDILIKSDTHFVGKQYRLPDFKDNTFDKKLLISAKYGTKDKNIDVKNILIENIKHNILSLNEKYNKIFKKDPIYGKKKELIITYYLEKSKKIELKFNENEKVELENIYHQDKGIYWKITSTPHIYYSNSSFMVKRDIKFNNPNEYYNHRTKNGHPRDWSNIHNFNESDIISDDSKKNTENVTIENNDLKINEYFDQIYIIHLNELLDRKKSIIEQIKKFKLKNLTIIDAINKEKINVKELKENELVAYGGNNYCKTKIINDNGDKCWCGGRGHNDVCNYIGRIACAFSHYLVYKDIVKNKYNKCLILEDDFILDNKLHILFNSLYNDIPSNFDLIYFCNSRFINYNNGQENFNNSFISIKRGVSDAGCYAVNYNTAQNLYENFLPVRAAADGYIGVFIEKNKINKIKNAYIYKQNLSKNGSVSKFKSVNDNITLNKINNTQELNLLNQELKEIVNQYDLIDYNSFVEECKNIFLEIENKDTQYKKVFLYTKNINPVLKLLYRDLLEGFKKKNFQIIYEDNINKLEDKSIIFISNDIKSQDIINEFSLKYPNSLFIGWCCHERNLDYSKLNFLYTTCHTKTPVGKQKQLVENTRNYCPLYHRCSENPELIGTFNKKNTYDWCYIGAPYRTDLIPKNFNGLNKGTRDIKKYLDPIERREIYLSSLILLGYQGDTNIRDGHVSQRVFEGLTYGCIVLSNSRSAVEQTNGLVEYVSSLKDVEEKINYYKSNPDKVKGKQIKSYEFAKKYGTNFYTIDKYNEKAKECFNIDFLKLKNNEIKSQDTIHQKAIEQKKVSIAISTYEAHGKGYKLLTKNLEQILTQSYTNIEVVISDHSKDDKIKNLCNKYQQLFNTKNYTLKYIQNTKYYGNSSQNTNNAIDNCTGEFIKILFMDDYLLNKDAIKLLVKKFEKESNKNKKWLVHSYQHTKDYKILYKYHYPSFNNNIALKNTIGCPSCLMIHSSVKERFDENLKWYMDSEYYSRLNKNYGGPIIKHTPNDEAYVVQLIHNKQVTNKDINDKLIKNEEKYINFFNKNNDFLMTRYTSNTLLNRCDVIIEKGKIIKDENSNNQSNNYKTIGIKSDHDTLFQSLNFFINNYLDKINNKFILYTNSGDWTLPNQLDKRWPERKKEAKLIYDKIINNEYLEHWFIENCDQIHNKTTFLPIGINPREFSNNTKIINNLTNNFKKLNIENKNSKIFYCSRTYSKNDKQFELRREYYEILKQDKFKRQVDTFDRLKQELFRNKLEEYSFCICIHGVGIDLCPKLFECLIYGCIPIINSSSYDNIYNKFPVVICKSIKDELNETNLKQWKEKFEPYFTNLELKNKWLPMLYQDYWLNYNNFK